MTQPAVRKSILSYAISTIKRISLAATEQELQSGGEEHRTQLCRNFTKRATCPHGYGCRFLHLTRKELLRYHSLDTSHSVLAVPDMTGVRHRGQGHHLTDFRVQKDRRAAKVSARPVQAGSKSSHCSHPYYSRGHESTHLIYRNRNLIRPPAGAIQHDPHVTLRLEPLTHTHLNTDIQMLDILSESMTSQSTSSSFDATATVYFEPSNKRLTEDP